MHFHIKSHVQHNTICCRKSIAHDAPIWSRFLKQIFLFILQDHQHYRQMELFCQTVQMNRSSPQCQVHPTALRQQLHQQELHLVHQLNKQHWFHHHHQFIFRLSHSPHILNSSTNHRSCLTVLSGHHIQWHLHNFQSNNRSTWEDFRRPLQETLQVHHQTVNQLQTIE